MNTLGEATKQVELLPIAARVVAVATYGSADVDRTGFDSSVCILHSAASSAGTGVTLSCKMQESDDVAKGVDNSAGAADTDNDLRDGTDSNIKLAAKFTQSGARQVKSVYLKLKANGTITAGKKVTATIETDSSGDPSGTAVHADATADVLCSAIGSSYGFVQFEFTRPVALADATVYHIVLTGDYDVSATNMVSLASSTVASGGNYNYYDSSWGTLSTTEEVVAYTEEYNFSDISGATFTAVSESAGSYQAVDVELKSVKKFIRMLATVAGTSASFQCGASVVLGSPDLQPVAG